MSTVFLLKYSGQYASILVYSIYCTAVCFFSMFLLQWTCTEAQLFVTTLLMIMLWKCHLCWLANTPSSYCIDLFSHLSNGHPRCYIGLLRLASVLHLQLSGMHSVPAEVRYSKACWRAWFCRWEEVVVRPCHFISIVLFISMCRQKSPGVWGCAAKWGLFLHMQFSIRHESEW